MNKVVKVVFAVALAAIAASASQAGIIFSDNWSDLTVQNPTYSQIGADWVIESGVFSADVTPDGFFNPGSYTGKLMVGTDPATAISVVFGRTQPNTAVEARFKLYQSNNAGAYYRFEFGFRDSATGYAYFERAAPNAGYYGAGTGTGGFHSMLQTGPNPADWTYFSGDIAGTTLSYDGRYDFLKIRMDQTTVEVWQAIDADSTKAYDDPSLTYQMVAHWPNFWNLASVDQFYVDNTNGVVSWFVDDVEIEGQIASGTLHGNVVPSDYTGALAGILINVDLTKGQTTTSQLVQLDNSGNFTLPEVPVGTYEVGIKACCWLRKAVGTVVVDALGNVDLGQITLINGDIDGDNEVTSTDLSILGLNLGMAGD